MRQNDKVLTHTLVNPQISHDLAKEGKYSDKVALHIVKETDAGMVVRGARLLATLGPHSDEIEVFPSTLLKAVEENYPFAFAFALPLSTPGIRLICRDTYDHGKSHFDAPLASRFEEMDSVVIFDDVLVPWERVFMYREPLKCNQAFAETNAVVHMMHQVACGQARQGRVLCRSAVCHGQSHGQRQGHERRGQIAEAMWIAETVRALLFSAEQQATKTNGELYSSAAADRHLAQLCSRSSIRVSSRLVQMLGSSSLMATPCEADFANDIAGDVEQYFQVLNLNSRDRVALFRLAHDAAISGFGSRQCLYERFFFGPQNIMASGYFELYNKDDMMDRVTELLQAN